MASLLPIRREPLLVRTSVNIWPKVGWLAWQNRGRLKIWGTEQISGAEFRLYFPKKNRKLSLKCLGTVLSFHFPLFNLLFAVLWIGYGGSVPRLLKNRAKIPLLQMNLTLLLLWLNFFPDQWKKGSGKRAVFRIRIHLIRIRIRHLF